jgi:hypothetical protein
VAPSKIASQLIESKQQLVKGVLEGGADLLLTELSDRELLVFRTFTTEACAIP